MNLSDEQKTQIAQQLAEGVGIADIQRLINQDFGIPMTYMETRFLMDDLDLDLADKTPEPEETDAAEADNETSPAEAEAELVDEVGSLGSGSVTVEVDKIKRPGAAMSGTVVFSDGQKAVWYLDPYGRLGLDPETEGYQPEPEDIQDFQMELQKQLQGPAGM